MSLLLRAAAGQPVARYQQPKSLEESAIAAAGISADFSGCNAPNGHDTAASMH
jgi:hypothetical protein